MKVLLPLLICAAALWAGDNTGRRAPGFALPDANLKVYDLADYRGKVLVLEFFQTDCTHCAAFAPQLSKVQQRYGDKIAILAVANTPHDNSRTVEAYIAQHKITYPVVFDQGQMEFSYLRKLSIDNPYVFVIDGDGVIRDDFGYGPFTRILFEGDGVFTVIDRVLDSNASVVPKSMAPKK